ncbi:MAG: hypothetical protein ACJAX3_002532 [Patiriisocius sp.]|jgi:hypothetical protein
MAVISEIFFGGDQSDVCELTVNFQKDLGKYLPATIKLLEGYLQSLGVICF